MQRPDVTALLNSLTPGVLIEAATPMAGIAPKEKMAFKMTKQDKDKGIYQFDVFYFNVQVAVVAAKIDANENLIWTKVN